MTSTRIMYIENKSMGLVGPSTVGRVSFSKTGKSISYRDRTFRSQKGSGFKSNYFDVDTGESFWISGPRKDGRDGLYGQVTQPGQVDDDVAVEYRRDIRERPDTGAAAAVKGTVKALAESHQLRG